MKTLISEEGKKLPEIPFSEYPRPLLKRDSYLCLNGKWDFEVNRDGLYPENYGKTITVPFSPESYLSGINEVYPDKSYYFYRRKIVFPVGFIKDRVIINFGAVEQECEVKFNGVKVLEHKGGYFPFSVDVTDYLKEENEITVRAYDSLNDCIYPYGKQKTKRGGMWYTPVSGIWQTVFAESVPENNIKSVDASTDKDMVTIKVDGISDGIVKIYSDCKVAEVKTVNGEAKIRFENPHYWSPDDPFLYYFTVENGEDKIQSYFAFRELEIKETDGIKRLCLNGKPFFFHGLLDQGYYSDGLFLPANPSVYENDIFKMKELGFNTFRKHIKIEPQLYYYYCDKYGIAVFQDMINNGKYSFLRDTVLPTVGIRHIGDKFLNRNKESRKMFIKSMEETVRLLKNHPSICLWTIFNEGWGQFCGNDLYTALKKIDKTRFIDTASGWFECKKTDVKSLHIYFREVRIHKNKKPIILSEFGGYNLGIKDHVFNENNEYGYKSFDSREKYMNALEELYNNQIVPLIKKGLCASVYTQLSDVEDETNGLLSYDRYILKADKEKMKKIAEKIKIQLGNNDG